MVGLKGQALPRGNKNALKHGHYTREAIAERRQMQEMVRKTRKALLSFS